MRLCSKENKWNHSQSDFEEFKYNTSEMFFSYNFYIILCVFLCSVCTYSAYICIYMCVCGAWVCMCVCVCIHRLSYNVAGCELVCLVLKSAHSELGVDFIRLILSSGAQAANLWNCWDPTARSRPRTGEYWLFGLFTPLDKPVFCFSFSLFKFFFFFTLCL